MKALRLFPTRKRSSRSLWAFWLLFFTFFIAVGSALTVSELLLLSNRKIVYTSLRTGNIEDRRPFSVAGEAFVDENDPVIFFGKDNIVVGRVRSVTAPAPQGDVLVLKRLNWEKTLSQRVKSHKLVAQLFPTSTFGVIYSDRFNRSMSYDDLLMVTEQVRSLNRQLDPQFETLPVPYLLRLREGKLGVN